VVKLDDGMLYQAGDNLEEQKEQFTGRLQDNNYKDTSKQFHKKKICRM
jgi:hypothetical protein